MRYQENSGVKVPWGILKTERHLRVAIFMVNGRFGRNRVLVEDRYSVAILKL